MDSSALVFPCGAGCSEDVVTKRLISSVRLLMSLKLLWSTASSMIRCSHPNHRRPLTTEVTRVCSG